MYPGAERKSLGTLYPFLFMTGSKVCFDVDQIPSTPFVAFWHFAPLCGSTALGSLSGHQTGFMSTRPGRIGLGLFAGEPRWSAQSDARPRRRCCEHLSFAPV